MLGGQGVGLSRAGSFTLPCPFASKRSFKRWIFLHLKLAWCKRDEKLGVRVTCGWSPAARAANWAVSHDFPHQDGVTGHQNDFFPCYFTLSSTSKGLLSTSFAQSFMQSLADGITGVKNSKNGGAGKINRLDSAAHKLLVLCWNGNMQAFFPKEAINTF